MPPTVTAQRIACTLANFGVCDLLLRLSERPRLIVVPHWSEEVLAKVHRTHLGPLGWPPAVADLFQRWTINLTLEPRIDKIESVSVPPELVPLAQQLGDALDGLPMH